jgi:hypothetical protein
VPGGSYEQAGKIWISTTLPSTLVEFYPESGIDAIASAVEKAVLQIIDEAK